MNPELRDYVLSLPLDVRLELAKCDGPGWWAVGAPGLGALVELMAGPPRGEIVFDDVSGNRRAWLPVSPIDIALHAATLGLLGVVSVTVSEDGCSRAESLGLFVLGTDGTTPDYTGHRAAIALLQKVMG